MCQDAGTVTCYHSADTNEAVGSPTNDSSCDMYSLLQPDRQVTECFNMTDIASPQHFSLDVVVNPRSCKKKCNYFEFYYALIRNGDTCYCYRNDPPSNQAVNGSCNLKCANGSQCGGTTDSGFATSYLVTHERPIAGALTPIALNVSDVIHMDLDKNATITFLIKVDIGAKACYRIIYGDDQPSTETDDSITTHQYTSPGSFILTIEAVNVHESQTKLVTVNVYQAIGNDTYISPLYGPYQTAFLLSMVMSKGTNVSCNIDFGDNTSGTVRQYSLVPSIDFVHTYATLGRKSIYGTCSNPVSSATVTASIVIQEQLTGFVVNPTNMQNSKGRDLSIEWTLASGTDFHLTLSLDDTPLPSLSKSFVAKTPSGNVVISGSQFMQYKKYIVKMKVDNTVTPRPLTITVYVDITYTLLAMKLHASNTFLETNKPKEFWALITGGYVTIQCDFGDGSPKTSKLQKGNLVGYNVSIFHRYVSRGYFIITCQAHDDLYSPVIQSRLHVTVVDGIQDLKISNHRKEGDTDPLRYNIILNANNFGTNSCFLIDFGDNEAGKFLTGHDNCTSEPTVSMYTFLKSDELITYFSHKYKSHGVYNVTVHGFNRVSRANAYLTIITQSQYNCVQPKLALTQTAFSDKRHAPTPHFRSLPISVTVIIGPSCVPIMPLKIEWSVREIINNTLLSSLTSDTAELFIEAFILSYGVYQVQISVAPSEVSELKNSLSVYIQVVPTPLSISIYGGSPRTFYSDKEIFLDASASVDPEVGSISGITFEWYCAKDNETIPRDGSDKPLTTMPSGSGGCAGNGPGRLNETGPTLTLPAEIFPAWTRLQIVLVGKKSSRYSEVSQVVDVIPDASNGIVITIRCKANCGTEKLIHKSLAFEGSCDSCTAADRTTHAYTWTLEENGAAVTDFPSMTETGIKSRDVVIKKDQLRMSTKYRLKLSFGFYVYAAHDFVTASIPEGGSCFANPKSGIQDETSFTFSCLGFSLANMTDSRLTYRFSYLRRGSNETPYPFNEVTAEFPNSRTTKLPAGFEEHDRRVDVYIHVCSDIKACSRHNVTVQVLKNTLPLTSTIKSTAEYLSERENSKDTTGLINTISYVSQGLPKVELGAPIVEQKYHHETERQLEEIQTMKSLLLDTMKDVKVSPTNIEALTVTAGSVTRDPDSLNVDSMDKMINILEDIGNSTYLTPTVSEDLVVAILPIMNDLTKKGSINCSALEADCPEDSDHSPSECVRMRRTYCEQAVETATVSGVALRNTLEKAMISKASSLVRGQVLDLKVGLVTATARRVDPAVTSAVYATPNGGSFTVNFSFIDAETVKHLSVVTVSSEKVLATADESTRAVKSGTENLLLSTGGTALSAEGLRDPIVVTIPAPSADTTSVSLNCSSVLHKSFLATFSPNDPNNEVLLFVSTDSSSVVDVYVNVNEAPNVTEGLYTLHERLLFHGDTSERKIVMTSPENTTAYNYTMHFKLSCPGEVTLNYAVIETGCLFLNRDTNKWRRDGLKLDTDRTSRSEIACLSTHLDGMVEFGAGFFVLPNRISFSTLFVDFARKLRDNALVIAVVCGLLVVYAFLALIMRRMDKKDIIKWATTPLSDNTDMDVYHYHMTVFTSARRNAGTKSTVFFMLAGESGDTEVRKLEDTTKNKELSTGSINNYLLSTSSYLGPLLYLRIWHDNAADGEDASWHLNRIVIKDIQTNEMYVFLCDEWMAVDKADGQLERLLPAASESDLRNFRYIFSLKTRHDMTDEHLWISLFSRPVRSRFTRVQRISCCLALLYATMIANCMFFGVEDDLQNISVIKLGPFMFSAQQFSISIFSSLVSVPVTVLIVTIFRKADKKPRKRETNDLVHDVQSSISHQQIRIGIIRERTESASRQHERVTKRNLENKACQMSCSDNIIVKKLKSRWPWWFIIVAYILVALTVVASGTFTIFYSLEWGGEKSSQWLAAFFLSFIESVVILQPTKIVVVALVISLILKKYTYEEDKDNSIEDDEIFEEEVIKQSGDVAGKPKPRHRVPFAGASIDPEKLERIRKRREKEVQMFEMFREVTSYLLYVLVICIVSYDNRDTNAFGLKHQATSILLGSEFDGVLNREQFWKWTIDTLVPALYKTKFYNGQPSKWRSRLYIDDLSIIRVGAPRIKQHRVKSNTCKAETSSRTFARRCYDSYSSTNADRKNYGYKWTDVTTNDTDSKSFWVYRTASELNGAPILGQLALYDGGGYVAELTSRPHAALEVLNNISQSVWLDSRTRAIFVEANLYNPNVNLFCVVTIMFEWMPTGSALHTVYAKPLRLYHHVGDTAVFRYIAESLFAVFTLYFIIIEGKKMYQLKNAYLHSFWNIIEIIIIVLSVATCGLYGMHNVISASTLKKFQENREEFTNFQYIVYWDEVFGYTLAFTVFLVMLKTLRVLRFNKTVSVLLSALRIAGRPLASFFFVFALMFCAFAQFAYSVFGRKLLDYSSFVRTLETQFSMLLMLLKFEDLRWASPVLGPPFFFAFIFFLVFVSMNMLITIINESFYQIQMNEQLIGDDYEIIDFMLVQFKKMLGINTQFVSAEEERHNSTTFEKRSECRESKKTDVEGEGKTASTVPPKSPPKNPIAYELYNP